MSHKLSIRFLVVSAFSLAIAVSALLLAGCGSPGPTASITPVASPIALAQATAAPPPQPTEHPTALPSPTAAPPTQAPSPTVVPTLAPSSTSTAVPTPAPSSTPTAVPTPAPSATPTRAAVKQAPGAIETACDHPYYPLRLGAKWTYTYSNGRSATTTAQVQGNAAKASADLKVGSTVFHYECDAEGIKSPDLGYADWLDRPPAYQREDLPATATLQKTRSGAFLPPAGLLKMGYAWSEGWQATRVVDYTGGPKITTTYSITREYTVTGTEPVTVDGKSYEGLQIAYTAISDQEDIEEGISRRGQFETGSYVLARGVGIVKQTREDSSGHWSATLTGFQMP
jgi:hypothetical protein